MYFILDGAFLGWYYHVSNFMTRVRLKEWWLLLKLIYWVQERVDLILVKGGFCSATISQEASVNYFSHSRNPLRCFFPPASGKMTKANKKELFDIYFLSFIRLYAFFSPKLYVIFCTFQRRLEKCQVYSGRRRLCLSTDLFLLSVNYHAFWEKIVD